MSSAPPTSPRPLPRLVETQDPWEVVLQWGVSLRPVWDALTASEWFVPFLVWLAAVALLVALRGHRRRQAIRQGGRRDGRRDRSAGRAAFGGLSRPCRWKKDTIPRQTLTGWHCMECGVRACPSDGRPPKECKRDLRGTAL